MPDLERSKGRVDWMRKIRSVWDMSLAELKKEAAELTAEEKRELAEFFRAQLDPQLVERRARINVLIEIEFAKGWSSSG